MKPIRLKRLLLAGFTGLLLFGLPLNALGRTDESSLFNTNQDEHQQFEIQALQAKMQEQGKLRVIVTLDLAFKPEGELQSMSAVQAQRFGIQQAQRGLLHRLQLGPENKIRSFKYVPQIALEVDTALLQELLEDPAVLSVQEDALSSISLGSSIPHIGADDAWAAGFTGAGQVVAILDTGVDSNHPFLAGKVIEEACYSSNYAPDQATTICPNGQEVQEEAGAAEPCSIDGCSHGTHVAGIAAGDGATFSGVAPDAKIIAIQVFTRFDDPSICGNPEDTPCIMSYYSDTISGLERVYELRDTFNIAAVNLSLGGGNNDEASDCDGDGRRTAIQNLRSYGIVTVAASGNNGYRSAMNAPACISEAISVGSTYLNDDVSSFSNVVSFLDFFAPGSSIYSSLPGDTYGWMSGTSMATPHVTGAWAVMRSKAPGASIDFIYDALSSTGVLVDDNRTSPSGTVTDIPRIQLDVAIDAILNTYFPVINEAASP